MVLTVCSLDYQQLVPWELVDMQILKPHPDLMDQKLWGWGPGSASSQAPPVDSVQAKVVLHQAALGIFKPTPRNS